MILSIRTWAAAVVVAVLPCSGFAQAPLPAEEKPVTPTVLDQPELVRTYQSTISADELAAHLYLFASDYFEGRATTTRGQKLAANYLASEYRRIGLRPMGQTAEGTDHILDAYMQPFPVYAERLRRATLTASAGDEIVTRTHYGTDEFDGQSFLAAGTIPDVSGPIYFAGYGISDREFGYDDFDALQELGVDVRGGWIMIMQGEPLADHETSLFPTTDGGPSEWTLQPLLKYLYIYREVRPKGILVVGDVGPRAAKPFAATVQQEAENLKINKDLSLSDGVSPIPSLPIYVVSSDFADRLLAGSGHSITNVRARINGTMKPLVFEIPELELQSQISRGNTRLQTENVLALIEGTDPILKNEYVVVSSHYDHIGMSDNREGDYINNGADDDGSGTVASLEMAEAFLRAKEHGFGPRRSILFINFSGEEQGLLGSEYFVEVDPVVPLDQIVTVLNMDMIGRIDPTYQGGTEDYVYVIGSRLISKELHSITEQVNKITDINLTLDERFNSRSDPNRFYARSDHWNFGKRGIPFVFFFTGTHEDYHQPGDEPHKIRYDRLAKITRLIFATAWQVANQDARPAVSGRGFN